MLTLCWQAATQVLEDYTLKADEPTLNLKLVYYNLGSQLHSCCCATRMYTVAFITLVIISRVTVTQLPSSHCAHAYCLVPCTAYTPT